MTKCICFLKSVLYLHLTSTSLHLLSTDKGQNSSSRLKTTVNIPSNSLDAWLVPGLPSAPHSSTTCTKCTRIFSCYSQSNLYRTEHARFGKHKVCTETSQPPTGKPMDWAVLCLRILVEGDNCKAKLFLPPTQNFSLYRWVRVQTSHPLNLKKLTFLTAICIYFYRRYFISKCSLKGPVQ